MFGGNFPQPRVDPHTVQPVASHYTDYSIPAPYVLDYRSKQFRLEGIQEIYYIYILFLLFFFWMNFISPLMSSA
jgi:ABC-type multidrug transport system permease subunit